MKNKFKYGFTLIELLVVIAIIGILASIIVSQLTNARDRGSDSAVKQDLDNIRPVVELYYTNNGGTYGTWNGGAAATCPTPSSPGTGIFGDQTILKSIAAASSAGAGSATRCVVNGNSYAIAVGLKTTGQSWCVDSNNSAKQFAGTPTAAITGGVCS